GDVAGRAPPPGPLPKGEGEKASGRGRLLCRCVFAADLRCRRVKPLTLTIETRLARPGALQIVAHLEGELAQARAFQFNRVAVHEAGQAAMVGAGGKDV